MRLIGNGICRNVTDEKEIKKFLDLGFKKVGCSEPQPSCEGLYVVDDYTISHIEKNNE